MRQKFQLFLNWSVVISLVFSSVWGGPGVDVVHAKPSDSDYQASASGSVLDRLISSFADLPDQIHDLLLTQNTPTATLVPTQTIPGVSTSIPTPTTPSLTCPAYPLGIASTWNVFMSGDVNHFNTDTQGRMAVGGNLVLENYSLGDQLNPAEYGLQDILIVGGDLTFTSGRIYLGNAVYGGTANVSPSATIDGQLTQGQRIDFGAAGSELSALSSQWAGTPANGTNVIQYWGGPTAQITLTGSHPNLNIFVLSGNDLSHANTLTINAPQGSSVVINVDGQTNQMSNFGIFLNGVNRSRVLYNFHQTTVLTLSGIGVEGNILAPNADINFPHGVIHGQLIGHSLTGMGQVNLGAYDGACVPQIGTPRPTRTPTNSMTFTPTLTWTISRTFTPSKTSTVTKTRTPTKTLSPTPTFTPSKTSTLTKTRTPSMTPSPTPSPTFTPSATWTMSNTPSSTSTITLTPTASNTSTQTPSLTFTPSDTPSATQTLTPSNTASFTPSNTSTSTDTPTPTFTATSTDTATPTSTQTHTLTPSATSTFTSTATLPSGVACINWQDANLNGWVQSPWMDPAAEIITDSHGMYGSTNTGSSDAGVYFAMPAGSYKVLFSGQHLSGLTVAQGSDAPTATTPLNNVIQPVAGSYFVTDAYLEIRWSVDAPVDLMTAPIFASFCLAPFTPTATKTPSATPTQVNIAPQVNAGENQFVVLPATSAQLDGIVSDDGLPANTLTITWSQVNGPGTTSFSDPNAEDTTVVFSESGVYVLRLTAGDGEYSVSDDVTIEIHAPSDLVVQSVNVASVVYDGQTLHATGSLSAGIKNNGQGSADGAFTISFFEDLNGNNTYEVSSDNLLGSVIQNGLAPGVTTTVSASVEGTLLFQGNLIHAFVDTDNSVLEVNENNNTNYNAGSCEYTPSNASFSPTMEWQWTGGTNLPSYNQVMMAPVIGDINEDNIPDIVFASFSGGSYQSNGHLRAISGQSGVEILTVTNSLYDIWGVGTIAMGDIDLDGHHEIVAVDESGNRLIAFEHDGAFKWRSPTIVGGINRGGPAIADLDGDGVPEIVVGSTVLNNDGTFRWAGPNGKGNNGDGPLSLIADLDLDGIPEIVAGNTAYRANGSVYWNNTSLTDGFNAIGNFDSDPFPEVVLIDSGKVYLLENNGALKWGPISLPGGGRGGAPTIADVDNDGQPEIGVAGSNRYTVFETDGTVKWTSVTQDASSNVTGSTVFDFEADGSTEVIYRDELKLRIYHGGDGHILWETPNTSGTTYELPVVADVDGDGNAEIIMVSNNYNHAGGTTGIQVYGDLADQWVATRQIWNQHTYHITNINDDGSIPAHEINNWDVHNNYRQNVLTAGCIYAKPDLTASYVRKVVDESNAVLTTRIGNGGGLLAGSNVPVSFYDGDPASDGVLLGTTYTSISLQPGTFQDVTLSLPSGVLASPIWVVADDDGTGQGLHTELNEENNSYNSHVYLTLIPNLAPIVSVDADQSVMFGGAGMSINLNGTVSDDGLPINQVTHSWTIKSGPGIATITDASSLSTSIVFSQPGVYVLRLTASDDELSTYDETTITLIAPPTSTPTALPSPTPTVPAFTALTIPGWIGSPANEATISSVVPITLANGVTLTNGIIDYWPADDTTQIQILAENLSGNGGDTLATFDPTVLPNGSYIIRLSGTDSNGVYQESGVLVTVTGEYKPGRVRFTITDLTVPVTGLPIIVGRTYDSLERNLVGDFGNGWSLAIGNPRLEVDQAHNVTMTMPDGERTTFHFTPTSYSGYFGFFMYPTYTPEPGEYGSMTVPDCLVIVSGGKYYCFLESGEYSPATYTYTDPYGRKFLMDADGTLKSITDLNNNVLTFSADGITSSAGNLNVPFVRDSLGRITQIIDPEGGVYEYVYDADGNLSEAQQPDIASPLVYHYDASHFFLDAVDPRGNTLIIDTYYPDGRLQSETDAQGNTWSYVYDTGTHTTTTTNPDNGTVVSVYNDFGKLVSQTDPLGRVTTFTYDANHNLLTQTNDMGHVTTFTYDSKGHPNSIKNGLNQTLGTVTYNQYGGPTTINDGLGRPTTVTYDVQFMPVGVSDSLGSLGGYTWDSHGNPLTRSNGAGEATGFGYDAYGNLTSSTDALSHSNTYTYDSLGRVLTSSDPLGHTTTYTYDALGHVLSVTDDDQHTTSYTYDNNGNLTHVTDPLLHTTVYTYDIANRVSKITYPDNTTAHFTYDFRGNVLTKTDALLHMTTYDYDEAGQLTDVTYASGTADEITVSYEYDDAGRKIREFDALGHKTEYSYDNAGRLITVTDALNHSTTNSYDILGQLLSTTDGEGHTTSYEYDVRGRLIRTTYADLTTSESTYDDAGRLLTSEDQAGRVTRYEYDDAGRMLNVTTAYGTAMAATTHYSYDNAGRMLTLTDALGHPTSYAYDDLGRVTTVTDPLTHSSTSSYNAIGQLIAFTDANDHTTEYEYDEMGRQTKTIFDDLSTVQQSYDANGQVLTSTDQNNKTTHYGYDALGRLTSVTNPMTQTVSYTYDAVGNPLSITDANLHTTTFAYDVLNRQIQKTWADQTSYETFTYNAVGNQLTHRMADGETNSFTYDVMNRLATASYADGSTYAFTYTDAGQPETVVDARGTTGYAYDAQGRLSSISQPGGAMVAYTYDLTGNRQTMMTSTGTVHYEYDAASQLIEVTDPNNQTTTFAYDDLGLRTEKALPNGVTTTYGYDTLNRLTDLTQQNGSTTLASYTYTLDAVGNRLSVTEMDGSSTHWSYDDAYRLLSETRKNSSNAIVGAASFSYDPTGNRLNQNINGFVTNYTYNELDQMLTAGSIQYGYDERGNMISATSGGQTAEYGYDSQNRQISVSLPNGTEITNTYDAGGRRVKQVVNSVATNYLWDEASPYGDVIRELSPGNMTSYVLAGSELLSQTHNGTTSYYLQDGQNSTRELTNSAGNVTDTYDYSAFGELQNQTGSTVNHYLYTGQQYDEATELYSLRARYYAPGIGRFMSQDTYPVNFNNPLELNRYVYTANNPTNYTDPSGNQAFIEYAIRGAAIGGGLGALAGGISAFACGGDIGQGMAFGFLLGAAFGGGLGALSASYPGTALAIGLGYSTYQAGASVHDFFKDGMTVCAGTNAIISLLFLGVGIWAANSYINSELLGGLSEIGYADDIYHPGNFTGENKPITGVLSVPDEVILGLSRRESLGHTQYELFRLGRRAYWYEQWLGRNLSDVDATNIEKFPLAFEQAMTRTSRINFDITDLNVNRAWAEGPKGIVDRSNVTNFEFYQIMTHPEWLSKTDFFYWENGMLKWFNATENGQIVPDLLP